MKQLSILELALPPRPEENPAYQNLSLVIYMQNTPRNRVIRSAIIDNGTLRSRIHYQSIFAQTNQDEPNVSFNQNLPDFPLSQDSIRHSR